jgi:hypothetical protein
MKPVYFLVVAAVVSAASGTLAAEERHFATGVRWVPLDSEVESYIRVDAKQPDCGGGRTIIVVFDTREQVEDSAAAENAVLDAALALMTRCKEIININVEGHLRSDDRPDDKGVISHERRIVEASVVPTPGGPLIGMMHNKAWFEKQQADRAAAEAVAQAKRRDEESKKREKDEATLAAQRLEFAAQLEKVKKLTQPQGSWFRWFGGGGDEKLIGIWSNPGGSCDRDTMAIYVEDGHRVVEIWGPVGDLDMAPRFRGEWTLDNDIVQMRFLRELRAGLLDKSATVVEKTTEGRVRLVSAENDSLHFSANGITDPHPLFLRYSAEKVLLRCQ